MERKTVDSWVIHHSTNGSLQSLAEQAFQHLWTQHLTAHYEAMQTEPFPPGDRHSMWPLGQRVSPDFIWMDEDASPASPAGTESATSSGQTELSLLALDAAAEATLRSNALSSKSSENSATPLSKKAKRMILDRLHTSTASRAGRR